MTAQIEITTEMIYHAALILYLRHPVYRNGVIFPFDELPTKKARLSDAAAMLEASLGKPMSSIESSEDGTAKQ